MRKERRATTEQTVTTTASDWPSAASDRKTYWVSAATIAGPAPRPNMVKTNRKKASIRAQARIYGRLDEIKAHVPDDSGLDQVEPFMAPLVTVSAFDLGQDRLASFSAYRFLYERLLGAGARPWLPGAFCAAASLPHLHPEKRRLLLQSISEAAATAVGWSNREPTFYPEWVEKVDLSKAN